MSTPWAYDEPCDTGEPAPQPVPPCSADRQTPNGIGPIDDVAIRLEGVL